MPRLFILLFIISFSPIVQSACNYSRGDNPVLYFNQVGSVEPKSVNGEFKTRVEGACFGSREISSWITDSEDGVVTSSMKPYDDKEFFYVTTFDPIKNESKIISVYQTPDGRPMKKILMVGKDNYENPKQSLTQMIIEGYDSTHGLIYFSVPAWATSDAIHVFNVPLDSSSALKGIKSHFLIDGNFKFLNVLSNECENCLVVKKIEHDDNGAYFPTMMYNWKGKAVCQLDTRVSEYGDLECLPKGVIYKPR
ncbi:hypothetical protein [Serratia proteamaculans]|uniref:hypothetical protein n=1 Tax=Serratia proteamaculans TaxID=28151 RepID=UPI002177DFB9|nr:hypothetical protein [Serratia proteamaculans]CAI1642880.1 Uncharacterised protein [Serratia proteamaculans]